MSFVDKTINSRVSSVNFFKSRLPVILEKAHQATASIAARAKERGMVIDKG